MDYSKHLNKAEEALRRKNFDFAVELYRQLLELDPDLGPARAGLRQALKARHDQSRGSKLLGAIGGAVPLAQAKAMHKLGRHEACARALESYLDKKPLDEEANLLLGISLEEAGHYESARACYEFLGEIAPRNSEGLRRAGAMSQRAGDHAAALGYYERALEADPRDQEAMKARKDLAAETAIHDTGLHQVGHSRELERGRRDAPSAAAADPEARLAELEAAHAAGDGDPDLLMEVARLKLDRGESEEALDWAERALSFRRDSYEWTVFVGDLRLKVLKRSIAKADSAGETDRANALERELGEARLGDLQRRLELRPRDTGLRIRLGKHWMKAGNHDEALGQLQKCLSDPRHKPEAQFCLGQCFQRKGVLELAQKQFEEALESFRGNGDRTKEILYSLGAIAETDQDLARARSYYLRIYEVDVHYRDVASKVEQLN